MRYSDRKKRKVKREPVMLARKKHIAESHVAARDEHEAKKNVLVAKPQEGPVDYAALRKRAMARFPKVLAHLAK